jgi:LysM repeat protein
MNTKRFLMVMMLMALAVTLVACQRSASSGPATATPIPPVPGATDTQNMGDLGTQTAVAQNPPQPQAVTQTPVPATNTPVPPLAPEARPQTYKLQKGEFPYCLARRFDVNPGDLLQLNGLSSSSRTYVGQELKIPQTGSFPDGRALRKHPVDYTVQANDTIYTIACYFGDVSPQAIANQNGLTDPFTVTAGNVLKIP